MPLRYNDHSEFNLLKNDVILVNKIVFRSDIRVLAADIRMSNYDGKGKGSKGKESGVRAQTRRVRVAGEGVGGRGMAGEPGKISRKL